MMKRLLALILSFILLSSTLAFAVDTSESCYDETSNQIIEELIQSRTVDGISKNNFKIISLAGEDRESEKAVQIIKYDNGVFTTTTIIPFKVLQDGSLVNSFKYVQGQSRYIGQTTIPFVDVSVTVNVYFGYEIHPYYYTKFYRHAGIEAYWSKINQNTSVNVTLLNVVYETTGDLYEYPTCVNPSLNPSVAFLESDFYTFSEIKQNYPTMGYVYIDGNNTMPYNRMVCCTNAITHGGYVVIEITNNGIVYDWAFTVYNKYIYPY